MPRSNTTFRQNPIAPQLHNAMSTVEKQSRFPRLADRYGLGSKKPKPSPSPANLKPLILDQTPKHIGTASASSLSIQSTHPKPDPVIPSSSPTRIGIYPPEFKKHSQNQSISQNPKSLARRNHGQQNPPRTDPYPLCEPPNREISTRIAAADRRTTGCIIKIRQEILRLYASEKWRCRESCLVSEIP